MTRLMWLTQNAVFYVVINHEHSSVWNTCSQIVGRRSNTHSEVTFCVTWSRGT